MNLYLISQVANTTNDTYDFAVVAAETEFEAHRIHPCLAPNEMVVWDATHNQWFFLWWGEGDDYDPADGDTYGTRIWANIELVSVEFIGMAPRYVVESGVICASFNSRPIYYDDE